MAKQINLLEGSIVRSLTALALPIMGSQFIQMAYNLTDMLWIGRVGVDAMAAVGVVGLFMWLSNGMAILARMGGQVLVAQNIGAGDMDKAGQSAAAALQLGALLALGYTLVMILGAGPLIGFFHLTGEAVIRDARSYMFIVALGMPFSFLNQILVALITASGNSRTPFLAMACGLGCNIFLDPVLIFGWFGFPVLGVAGAAIATALAQGIVFAILCRYAVKDTYLFPHVPLSRPASPSSFGRILKISWPIAAFNMLFPIISMIIARMVAAFGDNAVAVQKVGSQIESLSWMTADGFASATNSFVGQNYGADNLPRAKKGFYVSFVIMSLWGLLCTFLLVVCAGPIFSIFIPDVQVLPMGVEYLRIVGLSELFICWDILIHGAYAGFGRTLAPSIVSTTFVGLRIPLCPLLSSTALGLCGIWWGISLTTICQGILITTMFCFFLRRVQPRVRD